jgi:excisionase family DNA binding protein
VVLFTPEQVASLLAVSSRSVREWLRSGKLKGVRTARLWRVRDRDIEEFLEYSREKQARITQSDDHFLEVLGCLSGEAVSSQEMQDWSESVSHYPRYFKWLPQPFLQSVASKWGTRTSPSASLI